MEDYDEVRYSSSRSPSPVPERKRSRSPEPRKSPARLLSLSPPPVPDRASVKKNTMEVEIEMKDCEFMSLKNSEKRSYTKRMRERNLLAEKHLVSVMQELLGQV